MAHKQPVLSKILIWDLGDTLIKADTLYFAYQVGLIDFMLYPLLKWKNPKKIYEPVLKLLAHHEPPAPNGVQGPPEIMNQWLAGTLSPSKVHAQIAHNLHAWDTRKLFTSKRQRQLVVKTIDIMFDSEKFIRCMKPIKKGIEILKECADMVDEHGKQLHKLYVLSNWPAHSVDILRNSPANRILFDYFEPHHIVLSGHLGLIKPEREIYTTFLAKYNLAPQDCIFIDNLEENIVGAQKAGIDGVLLENGDYDKLRADLKNRNVLL